MPVRLQLEEFPAGDDRPRAIAAPSAAARSRTAVIDEFAERPELFVGVAFAGGLVIALILRLIGR